MLNTSEDEADRIFRRFGIADRQAAVAAVSGGSDSLALLLLLKRWIDRRAPSTHLVAVTVDHGLRQEAADEAREVAAICLRWGVAHRTVQWIDAKPATGVADAARLARYRLLADAAEAAGTDLVFTGHTLDDQAETVAMRVARGDGRGLAGMARSTRYDGRIWIVRPLLGKRRQALRDLLTEAGERWIDDPSNQNLATERVRIRNRLAASPHQVEKLVQQAEEAGRARRELGLAAASCLEPAEMVSPGLIRLPVSFFDGHRETAIYALRILLAATGGVSQLPDLGRTTQLFDRLGASSGSATLSRTLIERRRAGLYLHREARGLPEPAMFGPRDIWDSRFRVHTSNKIRVEPTGVERAAVKAQDIEIAPRRLVTAALAAEPCFEKGAIRRAGSSLERLVSPWALFLPDFDIAPNNAVARLLGAPLTPFSPSERQNGA